MFQGKAFVCRFKYRIAVISTILLAFAQCSLHAQAFTPPINVSGQDGNATAPRMAVDSHGNVDVVWLDDSAGTAAVFFSRSSDGGQTFSAPLNISNHAGSPAESERVAVDSTGGIYVVWSEDSSGAHTIFFSRSTDNGMSFSVPQSVSQNAMGTDPAIAIDSAGGINLLWIDKSQAQRTIFFTRSTDQGRTFTMPVALSTGEAGNGSPHLITDTSGNRYVVWTQEGTGNTQSVIFSRDASASANSVSSGRGGISARALSGGIAIPSNAEQSVLTDVQTSYANPRSTSFDSSAVRDESGSSMSTMRTDPVNPLLVRRHTVRVLAMPGAPVSAQTTSARRAACSTSRERSQMAGPNADSCNSPATEMPQYSPLLPVHSANAVQYFDCAHYSCFPDVGQGINKALGDVGRGGTVLISLGSITGTVSTTITVRTNQSLICDPATVLQPGNTTVSMIAVENGATVRGCSINTTNQGGYSGAVFSLGDNYRDNSRTSLSDIMIDAAGNSLCDGIFMSGSNVDTQSVAFVSLTNIHIYGCNNGLHLLSNGGFVNGNLFQDVHVSWAVHAFNFQNTSKAPGATISGNECS